ncbi:MAG: undecaprenyl-diphosphate phosphatase [Erysipelotrichaceae bacterium]|nr:undecaprenyl-diphosphate phosphatase [Erysipelotrichaceae bacterium]
MNILKAILFGIIEGITEWIPVSSGAHLSILNRLVTLDVTPEFLSVFKDIVQFGAFLALLIVLSSKIWPFGKSKNPMGEGFLANVKKDKFALWIKIIVACLPVLLYKLILSGIFRFVNENNEMIFIAIAMIAMGICFIATEVFVKGKNPGITSTKQITIEHALIIGVAQLVAAIFPGVSYIAAALTIAVFIGISRSCAYEFSLETAIPVMLISSVIAIINYIPMITFENIIMVVIGISTSFIVSILMISFVMEYFKKNNLNLIGIYRILMGVIVIMFLI